MARSPKVTQPPLACQMELSADGVGEAFYTELGEASPDMARLFARPKSLQASLLESAAGECHAMRTCRASAAPGAAEGAGLGFPLRKGATSVRLCSATSTERAPPLSQAALFMRRLDTLVSMADDPAALFNDTRALSVRHVKVPSRPRCPSSLPSDGGDAALRRCCHTSAERRSPELRALHSSRVRVLKEKRGPSPPLAAQYGARPEDCGAFAGAFVDTVAHHLSARDEWCTTHISLLPNLDLTCSGPVRPPPNEN